MKKDNSKVRLEKDETTSYVYIYDDMTTIGYLAWDYNKKKWRFKRFT